MSASDLVVRCRELATELHALGHDGEAALLDTCDRPWSTAIDFWMSYLDALRRIRRRLRFKLSRDTLEAMSATIRDIENSLP